MKRIIPIFLVIFLVSVSFGFEISALGGMKLSGKNRPYIGARIGTLSGGVSLMLEAYYPLSSFEDVQNVNIAQVRFLEIDPYLYLGLPISSTLIYVGVAPIVIFDIANVSFALYSLELFHAKAGIRFGQGIVFFVEGLTTLTTSFETLGIYAVSAGLGIGF